LIGPSAGDPLQPFGRGGEVNSPTLTYQVAVELFLSAELFSPNYAMSADFLPDAPTPFSCTVLIARSWRVSPSLETIDFSVEFFPRHPGRECRFFLFPPFEGSFWFSFICDLGLIGPRLSSGRSFLLPSALLYCRHPHSPKVVFAVATHIVGRGKRG